MTQHESGHSPMKLPVILQGSLVGLFIAASLLTPCTVLAVPSNNGNLTEYQLPTGTMIPILLQEEVSSQSAVVGQPISAVVTQDLFIDTHRILSRSDRILGRITRIQPPIQGQNATLKLEFDTLALHNGVKLPLFALVKTNREDNTLGGEATTGTVPEIIPYNVYGIGTYGRVMYHGSRALGEHLKLPPGTRLILVLQEPFTLYAF